MKTNILIFIEPRVIWVGLKGEKNQEFVFKE